MTQTERMLVNETASLVELLNPGAFASIKSDFPEFIALLENGPDAGSAEENREYVKRLALLALRGTEANEVGVNVLADKLLQRIKRTQKLKLFAILCGGMVGMAALIAILFGKESAAMYSAAVGALASIVNGVTELLTKQYTDGLAIRVVGLKSASESLLKERLKLELMIETNQNSDFLIESTNKCNDLAAQILREQNLLSIY